MNGDKYKPIIRQYESASDIEDKIECIFTMLQMVACNHLHDVEENLRDVNEKFKKLQRRIYWVGSIMLFAILFSDQINIIELIKAIIKAA